MQTQGAYTLVELLTVIAVIAMTLLAATPFLSGMLQRTDEELLQDQLMRAIQFTRSESLSRQVTVTLCRSNDQVTCSGEWIAGQIVFIDPNQEGIVYQQSQLLAVFSSKKLSGSIHWQSFNKPYLSFSPSGATQYENGTFWYCRQGAQFPQWAIIVSQSGRSRIVQQDQQVSIHDPIKDSQGRPLTC